MRNNIIGKAIFLVVSIPVLFIGCGRQQLPADMPRLYPVSVVMTQEGNPLIDALVSFAPLDTASPWSAVGKTDANGIVSPYTHGQYEGLATGKYKVCVVKSERVEKSSDALPPMPTDPSGKELWRQKVQQMKATGEVFMLVNKKYSSPTTTDLEVEVTSERKSNRFTFDVGEAVRILDQR